VFYEIYLMNAVTFLHRENEVEIVFMQMMNHVTAAQYLLQIPNAKPPRIVLLENRRGNMPDWYCLHCSNLFCTCQEVRAE